MRLPDFLTKFLTDYFRWTAGAVVVLILTAGYFLLIESRINDLRTSGFLEKSKVEAELAADKDYLAKLNDSIAKFHQALPADKLAAVDHFVPSGPDFPGLVLMLEDIATTANLKLDAMTVSQVAVVTPTAATGTTTGAPAAQAATVGGVSLRTEDVTVDVSGGVSYDTFKNFVALLESSQRLMDVISVNFSNGAATATGGQASGKYTLTVRTYYLPPAL